MIQNGQKKCIIIFSLLILKTKEKFNHYSSDVSIFLEVPSIVAV